MEGIVLIEIGTRLSRFLSEAKYFQSIFPFELRHSCQFSSIMGSNKNRLNCKDIRNVLLSAYVSGYNEWIYSIRVENSLDPS
jgi:hypothetical protein